MFLKRERERVLQTQKERKEHLRNSVSPKFMFFYVQIHDCASQAVIQYSSTPAAHFKRSHGGGQHVASVAKCEGKNIKWLLTGQRSE